MQSGKLLANGTSLIRIALKERPVEIKVWFQDNPHIIPCNPHHHYHDHVSHRIQRVSKHHDKFLYILVIEWKTSEIREIAWEAFFESDEKR